MWNYSRIIHKSYHEVQLFISYTRVLLNTLLTCVFNLCYPLLSLLAQNIGNKYKRRVCGALISKVSPTERERERERDGGKSPNNNLRCHHCAGPLSKHMVLYSQPNYSLSLSIIYFILNSLSLLFSSGNHSMDHCSSYLIRDSFSMIGSAVGGVTSAFYGFNHVMPVVQRRVKGPMWLHFLIGAPPVIVFSSACAGLAGGAIPAAAQLVSSSYYAAFHLPPYLLHQRMMITFTSQELHPLSHKYTTSQELHPLSHNCSECYTQKKYIMPFFVTSCIHAACTQSYIFLL
ncbi:hypothetical protein Lalb_Chr00c36g0408721 [Lupinus albus]|uniref:Transmembrane protein n=1 Tax=Lupinus albus TaxID=3870 RepID=A0A6A4N9C9_LUPAL|nr:hypothetical protein Lalb_Chr00c36g0408721 [Lupinus albus]